MSNKEASIPSFDELQTKTKTKESLERGEFIEHAHAAIVAKDEAVCIETNERGGKQSKIKGRMTEVPPLALIEVSKVMGLGSNNYPREADGTPNWHKISCAENLDHALEHFANYQAEVNDPYSETETKLEELSHFAARAMMAMEQFIREEV